MKFENILKSDEKLMSGIQVPSDKHSNVDARADVEDGDPTAPAVD